MFSNVPDDVSVTKVIVLDVAEATIVYCVLSEESYWPCSDKLLQYFAKEAQFLTIVN